MLEEFLVLPWFEITVASIVGAVLSLVGTGLYNRLHQPPHDYELWIDVLARPLISEYGASFREHFEFLVQGKDLEAPFVTEFYLWSTGNRDITVDNFDQGEALTISLGQPLVYHERVEMKGRLSSMEVVEDLESGSIVVAPGLIRRGSAVHYRLITDGYPELSVTNPVVDLEHYSFMKEWTGATPRRRKQKVAGLILAIGAGIMFLASIVVFLIVEPPLESPYFTVLVVLPVLIGMSGMQLFTLRDLPPKRARRAVKCLQKALNKRVLDWSRTGSDVLR